MLLLPLEFWLTLSFVDPFLNKFEIKTKIFWLRVGGDGDMKFGSITPSYFIATTLW